jgi:pyruvate kinase
MSDNMTVKRTKIVATVGPASSSEQEIRALAQHGVDVFRINFSHGTDEERLAVIATIKRLRAELDLPLPSSRTSRDPRSALGHSAKAHAYSPPAASFDSRLRRSIAAPTRRRSTTLHWTRK